MQLELEVHRLSADNRYRSFHHRHRPIICFSKQNNKKCF